MGDLIRVDNFFFEGHNIKCGMERVSALNVELRFYGSQEREKVKYPDKIPVSGKTPVTQEKPKK